MRALCILLLAACSAARTPVPVESRVRDLTPALRLTFEPSTQAAPAEFDVRTFSYVSEPPHEWPYGTGFVVADRATGEVLWIYLHHGDFAPHEIRWADFDGDGREDLFFHAGSEDVFTTHLYANRVRAKRYGVSNFVQTYANDDVYAVVVDFDADRRPELIAPDAYPSEDDPCAAAFSRVARASEEWKAEYRPLAGSFDAFNFHFGVAPEEADLLHLFAKPAIVSFGAKPDAAAVARHLRLRQTVIAGAMEALPEPCHSRAEEVGAYLADLIREHEQAP